MNTEAKVIFNKVIQDYKFVTYKSREIIFENFIEFEKYINKEYDFWYKFYTKNNSIFSKHYGIINKIHNLIDQYKNDRVTITNREDIFKKNAEILLEDSKDYFSKYITHKSEEGQILDELSKISESNVYIGVYCRFGESYGFLTVDLKYQENQKYLFGYTLAQNFLTLSKFIDEIKEQIENIRSEYLEEVMFSTSVEHWKRLRENKRVLGGIWAGVSLVIFCLLILFVSFLYLKIPENNLGFWNAKNLKGTFLSIVGLSSFIYILRVSIKIMLSNYHLESDANERVHLTHFYLSLIKKDKEAVNIEQKNIVFQSLFSRSETGLLSGDSTPVLPNNLIDLLKKQS